MVTLRRRTTVTAGEPKPALEKEGLKIVTLPERATVATGEPEPASEKERGLCGDLPIVVDDSSSDLAVMHLRGSWELASVLNFLNVFGPLVSDKLKLTAEKIEMGLIESNATNAKLHIALLKGIPPVSKSLEDGDAWITSLCKILAPWWPWVAKGEIPVTANKGEEISAYKVLDPINRLKFLKALCELRVQQDDVRKYIQENAKEGDCDSCFRKRKLGGDGKKTSYWFDGSDIQGYRLYREVNEISKSAKAKKNPSSDISCFCWETEATTLDEFQRVARELYSNKASSLAAVAEMIETDAIPVVEKYHKKKEKEIKRKRKQEKIVCVNFSRPIRATRACRNRIPATYTFDEYDKMINEAVAETEETDEDEEDREQSASMESSEANKMKSGEDEVAESDVKENEKSKDSEGKKRVETKTDKKLRSMVV